MKKYIRPLSRAFFLLIMIFSLLISNFSLITEHASAAKKSNNSTKRVVSEPSKGSIRADCAILMELSTGTVLYSKNIHKRKYPASITKILTTYLACENCSLDETVTFSKKAVNSVGWDTSRLWPFTVQGEEISLKDCLYGMMLASANEVCYGVGEHVSGSLKNFVDLMNQTVKDLGLKNSHFANASGLHDSKHYTSAYDMATIARAAMQNPTFRKVTSTKTYVMKKTNKNKKRTLTNHHCMLSGYTSPQYEYKYCIGGKTGYTSKAGNTLVTYAEKGGMQLICVVLDSTNPESGVPNEYSDTITLLNYGFEKYTVESLNDASTILDDTMFSNFTNYFGSDSPLKLSNDAAVVLPKGTPLSKVKKNITYTKLSELKPGENVIGHVVFTYGSKTAGSADIIYDASKASKTSLLPGVSDGTQKKSSKAIVATKNFKNKFRFKATTFFTNVVNFLKTKTIFIIIGLLVIVLLYLLFLRRKEIKRTTGSGRFAKQDKKSEKSEEGSGFLSFSGKRRKHSSSQSNSSVGGSEFAGPTFGGKGKKGSDSSKNAAAQHKSESSSKLNFGSKKHTMAARKSSPYGMVNDRAKRLFKKNRRYSWTVVSDGNSDNSSKSNTTSSLPPNMNSRKNKRRHKKTISSFDQNLFDHK
ncbi:MAG: D-alanyl-D-alanine carboxypeptidase [Lachnospiraceae bacterium]|nr:D-alanyl-D-alanine carboxypeptidase [Lachnospiraceae bacterium]